MKTINFSDMKTGKGRQDAIDSEVCLIEFKGSGTREVQHKCLLVNVTGMSDCEIEDLADDSAWVKYDRVEDKS